MKFYQQLYENTTTFTLFFQLLHPYTEKNISIRRKKKEEALQMLYVI